MSTHIHRMYIYETILPLGELVTDRLWLAPKIRIMGCRKRNGFGENLSCLRFLEEHSLRETIECYRITRGRTRVQIAEPRVSVDDVWSHPTIFHPPIDTHGTYTNHPQGRLKATRSRKEMKPKSHWLIGLTFQHMSSQTPHSCAFGHQMMFP